MGVRLIPSYSCIEVWFLWHVTDELPWTRPNYSRRLFKP